MWVSIYANAIKLTTLAFMLAEPANFQSKRVNLKYLLSMLPLEVVGCKSSFANKPHLCAIYKWLEPSKAKIRRY
ncbi:hypothetical protein C2869_11015 [Saccharobesus litoralis]|uniref:Uncharacterized protein n=1 Tax=Saccharobesus litoralis TaxID=2172099 RepID=A0A2S0VRW3_9ALTE|nr:hypothetical protein C2869_11015 [Saccharobesus litoralis]